jgi:hypothetical protein
MIQHHTGRPDAAGPARRDRTPGVGQAALDDRERKFSRGRADTVPGGRVGYAGLCLRAALVLRCLGPARTLVGKGKLRRPRLPHVANGELSLWAARHDWAMHLTSNEIAGGSVAVASLAIIGGIYSARMTSRDAVKIAREERSSRRQNEQDVLKRTIYANCLAALMALMLEKRMSPVTRLGSAEDIRAGRNVLFGAAFIGAGAALIAAGVATLTGRDTLYGAAVSGIGVALIAFGLAVLADREALFGAAIIGVGVAIIGPPAVISDDRPDLCIHWGIRLRCI